MYDATDEGSGYEEEMEDNSEDDDIDEDLQPMVVRKSESKEVGKQVALVRQFYSSPGETGRASEPNGDEKSNTDSEYMPGDSCSSSDDDEATQICRKFKDYKKKLKRGKAASLDDVIYEGVTSGPQTRQARMMATALHMQIVVMQSLLMS
jgi:alpha-galactosidase